MKLKSCLAKNADDVVLTAIIKHNLAVLDNMIEYNIKNGIKLFRISSDIIPFASNSVNKLPWWDMFAPSFQALGEKIVSAGIRVSMHPGQYTVLNSVNKNVVKNTIADLDYHTLFLDSLGVGEECKIVLHIGGIYGNKKQAIERFLTNYSYLEPCVKKRLVLENDDKCYNIDEVLEIAAKLNMPVVFDNLHNQLNPYDISKKDNYWLELAQKTWQQKDGRQKIHYSQQNLFKPKGAHSETILIKDFMLFFEGLLNKDIDIMLEVKDKNLSAVKCMNSIAENPQIKLLGVEWNRYKYKILENSPNDYLKIRELLNDKSGYPAIAFYESIESALTKEVLKGNAINTALHIWGYFKNEVSVQEKAVFFKKLEAYQQGIISVKPIKEYLWKLVNQYGQNYLAGSYYFTILNNHELRRRI
jgi:UV DNA damage endonuclease